MMIFDSIHSSSVSFKLNQKYEIDANIYIIVLDNLKCLRLFLQLYLSSHYAIASLWTTKSIGKFSLKYCPFLLLHLQQALWISLLHPITLDCQK